MLVTVAMFASPSDGSSPGDADCDGEGGVARGGEAFGILAGEFDKAIVGAALALPTAVGNEVVDIREALDALEPGRRGEAIGPAAFGNELAPVLGDGGGGEASILIGLSCVSGSGDSMGRGEAVWTGGASCSFSFGS